LWRNAPEGDDGLDTAKRLARLLREVDRRPPCPLVVTGDVTDLGSEADWKLFTGTVDGYRQRPCLLPGNHDIAINRGFESDRRLRRRQEREARFVEAARRCGGESAGTFPVMIPLEGATLILLDSNRYRSRYVLSNAIGLLGRRQLKRLETTLRGLRATPKPLIVAMHHHLAFRRTVATTRFQRIMDRFKVVLDGRKLVRLLQVYAQQTGMPVLVIHGHQHETYRERIGDVLIYGHPSSTLGEHTSSGLDGHLRFAEIGLTPDNRFIVAEQRLS
jgi:3',5'-cyclic AMP phosphodiesterase CpdA